MAFDKTIATRDNNGVLQHIISPTNGVVSYETGATVATIDSNNDVNAYPSGNNIGPLSDFLSNYNVEK